MLAFLPAQLRIAFVLVIASLVLMAGTIVYGKIYDRGWNAHVVVAEKEKAALKAANEKAIREANAAFQAELAKLSTKKEGLEAHVQELDKQADADPAGDRNGLSAGSVRRIDAVR